MKAKDSELRPVESPGPRARRPFVNRLLRPFQQFFATESAGGVLLLLCAIIAIAWANSPASDSYFRLWESTISIGFDGSTLTKPLHAWINDGLMVVFFLLVGLEIKREVFVGELSSMKQAVLPIAAAFGGMVVPAAIYSILNAGGPGARGWGIPMATDIAFALGVLALLGNRLPSGLRVFLAALAIADDLGAVLVIALFYTSQISYGALTIAGLIVFTLIGCNISGIRRPSVYALLGVGLWLALLNSGIHPTIAGVLLAATIPSRTRIDEDTFVVRAREIVNEFESACVPGVSSVLANRSQQETLQELERTAEGVQSPLLRLEHSLHAIVAFGIMPLFALANAGIRFEERVLADLSWRVVLGVAIGLVVGKTVGIFSASRAIVATGRGLLPENVTWSHLFGVSWLGGIGFTMSLFVASLAFGPGPLLDSAKIGVLAGSTISGIVGSVLLAIRARAVASPA